MARFYNELQLKEMTVSVLRQACKEIGVSDADSKKKAELVKSYLEIALALTPPEEQALLLEKPKKVTKKKETTKEDKKETIQELKEVVKEEEKPKNSIEDESAKKASSAKKVATKKASNKKSEEPKNKEENVSKENTKEEKSLEEMLESGECERAKGLLDILTDGYGFLRVENCEPGLKDVYVSARIIKSLGLRMGDMVEAIAKKNYDNKPSAVIEVERVNGFDLDKVKNRPNFDRMVPIFPNERLKLELDGKKSDFAIRCIDLVAPIGKGQRALIVSPPKAGKTTLLKKIAQSITQNYPEVELYVLLIDERPEEVTDMQRSINREVIYSTFDETPEHHCKAAELLIERAKRSVELGKDVVIIMDSLTRLARAYNITIPPTGRTLSGGLDPGALHPPKKFFGSARNIENGGSLTIVATALVDTGSRMDDVIYEEFKGTGNMEIHLDRKLSERRIFPAIDIAKSSTRREDLLLNSSELQAVYAMRKWLVGGENADMTEKLFDLIVKSKDNDEFCKQIIMNSVRFEKEGFKIPKL